MAFGLATLTLAVQGQVAKCPPGSTTGAMQLIQPRSTAPDFSTTFTDGTNVNLYTTLNSGNTVMLDFFFTTWSYCQSYAGTIETSYVNHGSGSGNIKYWGISDRDGNAAINTYKTTYGITNPCAGTAGNGNYIINTLYAGSFNFLGFPTYSVICPNKTINWDCNYPPTATGFNTYYTNCGGSAVVEFNPKSTKFTTIYPNPASERTTIDFYLDNTANVSIEVYNVTGQKVFTIAQQNLNAGFNYTVLPLDEFSNGMYIIKLVQNDVTVDLRKLSVTK
jgi:hypothetical protein